MQQQRALVMFCCCCLHACDVVLMACDVVLMQDAGLSKRQVDEIVPHSIPFILRKFVCRSISISASLLYYTRRC